MTSSLLKLMVRPAGPSLPLISFDTFLEELRTFRAASAAAGLTTFSWRGWQGSFATDDANSVSVAIAGHIAVLAMACGGMAGLEPAPADIVNLHFRYLAIDSTSADVIDPMAAELAQIARNKPIAVMIPDLFAARQAIASFAIARLLRVQWLPARTRFDELSRTWWLARRIDMQATHLDRATQILGMSVPIFVRAASALIALGATSEPELGRVDLNREIDQSFIEKYDVDLDALRLAAFKLSISRDELQGWLRDLLRNAPPGLLHYAPSPLATTPLLRCDDLVEPPLLTHTLFLCPSVYHFIGAVRDRVREAISEPNQIQMDTQSLYGELLNEYVAKCMDGAGQIISIDVFDRDDRRADWLISDEGSALIIEVKRALATGGLSRHLVTARGMAAVLEHIYGAYDQCRSTYSRARWIPQCGNLTEMAAMILIDEPVGAEGAVVAELLSQQTAMGVDLPFEVMSVSEFEHAIRVLGVKQLVSLIRRKWRAGHVGLPLGVFFLKVLGESQRRANHVRNHVELENRELFLELGFSTSDRQWPL